MLVRLFTVCDRRFETAPNFDEDRHDDFHDDDHDDHDDLDDDEESIYENMKILLLIIVIINCTKLRVKGMRIRTRPIGKDWEMKRVK